MAVAPKRRIGLYPGTFDPITFGHLDIIRRAVKLVDELIIGVAINTGKNPLFSLEERVRLVQHEMDIVAREKGIPISVRPFDSLLVHFAEEQKADVIIRGLRAVSDFEYEFQMVGMNDMLSDHIETVFLMADVRYQAIASRLVKEIARLDGDIAAFVPDHVATALNSKLSS